MKSLNFNHTKYTMFKRSVRFLYQRLTRGWDDTETWNLDARLSEHIIPRLKRFKEVNQCYPPDLTPETWDIVIDKMIFSFEWTASPCEDRIMMDDKNSAKVREGLDLFAKYFQHLWW